METRTGKIKWFSAEDRRGAIATIGGADVPFASQGEEQFSPGDLISYTVAPSGDRDTTSVGPG